MTPLPDNHSTGKLAGTHTERSVWEPNDTLLPMPHKMARNECEILPIPRKITHRIPLKVQGDNGILQLNLGPDQPQKMTPQQVTLPLHPSSYSPAIYDSTNPVVESSYINYRLIYSQVWYNALMAAHNELYESQIPYGQAVKFHINTNECRLSQERMMTSELKSLKSKLRDLQHVLQTHLNEV